MIALLPLLALAAEPRYAVVIGANQGVPGEEPLRFAEADALRMAQVLTGAGGMPPEAVVTLRSPTADQIRGVLARLSHRVALESPEDALLVVYYSGHADAQALHLGPTYLPLDELTALVDAVPADARVLVLDACRTGELTRRKGAVQTEAFEMTADDRLAISGLAILTSAAQGEDAQESDRLRGGVFTHHLVAGLSGAADRSGDLRVTLEEAYAYTYDRTVASTSVAPVVQHPSFKKDMVGRDELVLTRLLEERTATTVRMVQQGDWLFFDRKGSELVLEAHVAAGGALAMRPGRYLVRRRTAEQILEGTIEVGGSELTIDASELAPVPYGQATRRRGTSGTTRSAVAISASGGVQSLLDVPGARASLGVRLDIPWATLAWSVQGSQATSTVSDWLVRHDRTLGAELGFYRSIDLGLLTVAPGAALGVEALSQSFESSGAATDSLSTLGWVSPRLRAELALGPRFYIDLEAGADAVLGNYSEDGVTTLGAHVRPMARLGLGFWIR